MTVYSHWLKGESSAWAMVDLATAIIGPNRGGKVVATRG